MTLVDLIHEHAQASAEAGDWAAVAAILNANTIIIRDSTPVTYASLGRDFGDAARQLVAGTIRAASKADTPFAGELADAHQVLLMENVGLRIDSDERQAVIDQLAAAGNWPDQLRDGIKQSRVRLISLAEQDGIGNVTADSCSSAWNEEQFNARWTAVQNELINPALATFDRTAVATALRSAADALEA